MIQEFQDEVLDTSGQSDNNPRYRIRDNSGTILQDDVQISLKTPVTQEGTKLNKAFFEIQQQNFFEANKYSDTASTIENVTGNPIPTTGWSSNENGDIYTNGDYKLSCDNFNTGALTNILAIDGSKSVKTNATFDASIFIQMDRPIKAKKITFQVYHDYSSSLRVAIYGSNKLTTNLDDWDELYLFSKAATYSTGVIEASLTKIGTYKYYRLYCSHNNKGHYFQIYAFFPTEYENAKVTLNYPIKSYEKGAFIRIRANATLSYPTINVNGLGEKQVYAPLIANHLYTLVYNGTSYEAQGLPYQVINISGNYSLPFSVYFAVAVGGGGGAAYNASYSGIGYGGAGGLVSGMVSITSNDTQITIGHGGAGSAETGGTGGTTSILGLTAYGGKGGSRTSEGSASGEGGKGYGGAILQGENGNSNGKGQQVEGTYYGKGGSNGTNFEEAENGENGVVILYPIA